MTYFTADVIYSPEGPLQDHYISVDNGVIQQVAPLNTLEPRAFRDMIAFEDALIVPGFVNTHNHSFQSLLKGIADDAAFFDWRDRALYRYGAKLTRDEIYWGALFAFSEMLKNGITTVCDFFYLNDQANENARAVIQAAKDLGIRLTLARTFYDWDGAPKRFQENVDQAVNNTEMLMREFEADQLISVFPAPHSLHGASLAMIQAGKELADSWNAPYHMHIAEGRYEREMIIEKTGLSPIQYLHQQGLLAANLVGIHCVWLDDRDIELMAGSGMGVCYNPSSNMFLGDGVTRISDLIKAGVSISLGTDGGCSNNRASIVEEMRMTSLLQKVTHCDATVISAEDVFKMGTVTGGSHLGRPIGAIAKGYAADLTVIDLDDLSMQPRAFFQKNMVYAMQPSAVQAVIVNGSKVFERGELLGAITEGHIVEKIQTITGNWEAVPSKVALK
ncbi:MAG: amidohydrolase [Cyanobacteria bacterium]|nr:amidohydrolase [Cyanobacteriota bacterium]